MLLLSVLDARQLVLEQHLLQGIWGNKEERVAAAAEAVLTGVVAVMAGWVEVGWEGAGKAVVAREEAGKAVVARVAAEKVEREVEGWEEACTTCNQPASHDSKLAALRTSPRPTMTLPGAVAAPQGAASSGNRDSQTERQLGIGNSRVAVGHFNWVDGGGDVAGA
ncbi:hypothetical protein ACK3TF_004804 [Chlorella vulgaris]